MGRIESNNAKMTLQNVKAKFQCNVTIVQSLYRSIKENESILKIQSDLFLAITDVNKKEWHCSHLGTLVTHCRA